MKKLFAMLLALVMCLALCVPAFATEPEQPTEPEEPANTIEIGGKTYTDATTVTIKKSYKLIGAGTSPVETFTLEQVGDGVVTESDETTAPKLGTITGATFAAGDASATGKVGEITIQLPPYEKVGVYTYTLKEVAGTTAGVTYYGNNIRLVVTVANGTNGTLRIAAVHTETEEGEDKSDTFQNTYSAGTLNISKTVTGNLGDKTKYFEFKVTLTGETGKTYGATYAVSGGSNSANPSSIVIGTETTFLLKHGETISIANLPYGVSYTVTETAADGYTTTKTGDTGSIAAAEQTAAFTNTRGATIDTGVMLDSMPYVLALVIVAGGAAVMFVRKRRVED